MQSAALGVYLMIGGALLVLIVSGWVAFEGWPGLRTAEQVAGVRVGEKTQRSADEPVQRVVVGSRAAAAVRRPSTRKSSNSREMQAQSATANPSRPQLASRRKPARRRSPSPSQTAPAPAASTPAAAPEPPAATPDPVSEVVEETLGVVDGVVGVLLPDAELPQLQGLADPLLP